MEGKRKEKENFLSLKKSLRKENFDYVFKEKNCFLLKNYHFGFLFKIFFFTGKIIRRFVFFGLVFFYRNKGKYFFLKYNVLSG